MTQIVTTNQVILNKIIDQITNTWSFSKHKRFLNCRRGFVFTDVIAQLGKRKEAGAFEKKVKQLNQMKSIDMLFGISLHNQVDGAIKNWFRYGIKPNAEIIYKNIKNELNQVFIDSKSQREKWKEGNGQGMMLQEIYYHNELPNERIEKVRDKMDTCPTAFCESSTLEEVMSGTSIKFDHAERNRTMIVENIRVKFVMDLVIDNRGKGKKVLVDWKTGVHSVDDFYQLCLYALYYVHVFKVDVERLSIVNEYLYANKEKERTARYPITMDDIARIKELMINSMESMADFLMSERLERLEDVLLLPETPNVKSCSWCNFREICHKG